MQPGALADARGETTPFKQLKYENFADANSIFTAIN